MPFSDPVIGHLGWVALALGSAILGGGRRRRLGAAGLVFVGLGLAAWRVSRVGTGGSLPALDDSGAGFLVVNGGLVLLGLGLLLWGAVADGDSPSRPAAGAAIVTGALLVAWVTAGHLPAAGLVGAAALAAGLGLAGAGLIVLGRAVASTGAARGMGRLFGPPLPPATLSRDNARFVALIVVGATAAAAGPSVAVVFLGVVVAAWGGYLAFDSPAARPAPVSPAHARGLAHD
ncbi:MAG: hypothetical protein ACREM9_02190 [Gemmatimonadales bacterium]